MNKLEQELLEKLIIANRQKSSLKFSLGKCYGENSISSIAKSYKIQERLEELEKEIKDIILKFKS